MKKIIHTRFDGFTLVELAIVMVILGLLVGGVMTGQNLIRAAELRAVSQEINRFQLAINVFEDQHLGLPGDLENAFDYWGVAAGCTDTTVTSANAGGCNGNGNERMEDWAPAGEDLRAVQFLAMAGLIEGSYTGLVASTGNNRQAGVNVAPSRYPNGVVWINFMQTMYYGENGNNLMFGAENGDYPDAVLFTPKDAWNIDRKMDDGEPDSGSLISPEGQATCHDDDVYALDSEVIGCTLMYWID